MRGKTFSVTLDNASNNDNLISYLTYNHELKNAEHHIRCFAHIINLAAQVLMGNVDDKIAAARLATKKIKYSNKKIEQLKTLCAQELPTPVPFLKPVLDVATRWNSTYLFLRWLIAMKKPLIRMFALIEEETLEEDEEVSTLEWVHYEWISDALLPLFEATELCCGQKYPTFSTILPLYNVLLDHLTKCKQYFEVAKRFVALSRPTNQDKAELTSFYPEKWLNMTPSAANIPSEETLTDLIKGCTAAIKKLDKYYNVQSDFAIVAVVLDPRVGLDFYNDSRKTIAEVQSDRDSAKAEVEHYFKDYCTMPVAAVSISTSSLTNGIYSKVFKRRKITEVGSQVEIYCSLVNDDVDGSTDILMWWKQHQKQFPQLAAMARDVLSAVGTSTPSERAFSSSKETSSDRRNRLSPITMEALQVCKSWLKNERRLG